jgi:large conductance mechanosensitive channel
MKKIIKEFRDFAIKGNAIELAVAVVLGTAFTKITTSLVNDVIMPFVTLFTREEDFTSWKIILRHASPGNPAVAMNLGSFVQNIVDFIIIAFVIFLMVKIATKFNQEIEQINPLDRVKSRLGLSTDTATPVKEELAKEEATAENQEKLLTEIRDLLKEKKE